MKWKNNSLLQHNSRMANIKYSFKKISTTRPQMSVSYCRSVLYTVVETKVSTINQPPNCVIWLNENAYQSTDRYFGESVLPRCCQMVGKSIAQRLAKVLPNVWQECFQTFGKSVFKRLIKVFSTFDKSIIQRLIKVLSNI